VISYADVLIIPVLIQIEVKEVTIKSFVKRLKINKKTSQVIRNEMHRSRCGM